MRKILITLLVTTIIFAAWVHFAYAATTPNSIITPQVPNRGIVQFLQGTDTAGTYKTLYTAGTNGSMVFGIYATTNDATASHLVTCQIVNTAVKYGGMAMTIGGSTLGAAGFANGVPALNILSSINWPGLALDANGNRYFYMVSGDTLQCTFATTLTSTDVINLVAITTDF